MIFVVYKEINMKKSKIIIPALAMIAFSTAASIAGSVAWFTASRQAVVNAGTYAVVKTTSNLDCALVGGVGTTVNGTAVTFNGKLTDGSFNHTSGNVYAPDSTGKAIDTGEKGEVDVGSYDSSDADEVAAVAELLERATVKEGQANVTVFTAATFDITFTVNFGAVAGDVGLFLNCTGTNSEFTTSGTAITAKGFRMGFYPIAKSSQDSDQKAKVFADLQSSDLCKYVAGTANIAGTSYAAGTLIDSSYHADLPDSETARATAVARPDYLGTFAYASQQEVTLTYRVVCWFEGTDENIVNRDLASEYQSVAAKLTFEAIDLAAAS
jgi:hypothetical protein